MSEAIGYYKGPCAVEWYKGEWIQRARMDRDIPVDECDEANAAMLRWEQRNKAKFISARAPIRSPQE